MATETTSTTIFQISADNPRIQCAYFSRTTEPVRTKDDIAELIQDPVEIYGNQEEDPEVHLHIRVEQLYYKSSKTERIHSNSELLVDLFAVSRAFLRDFAAGVDQDEDLAGKLKDEVRYIDTMRVKLSGDFKDQDSVVRGDNADRVAMALGLATDRTVTVTECNNFRSGEKSPKAKYFDLCFRLDFTEEQQKELFDLSQGSRYLFAWVWLSNTTTQEDYQQANKLDITGPENRCDFLMQKGNWGLEHALVKGARKILGIERGYVPRRTYYELDKAGDDYPFDEPTLNVVRILNQLPVQTFEIAAQLGPIGIRRHCGDTFSRLGRTFMPHDSIGLYEGEQSMRVFLDSESTGAQSYGTVQSDAATLHGHKNGAGEFHSRGDDLFFFKARSAAHWLNSLEKRYPNKSFSADDENAGKSLLKKGSFPFDDGKVEVLSHDFLKDYREEDLPIGPTHPVYEQKIIDFADCKTIQVLAPTDPTLKYKGAIIGSIGKGLAGLTGSDRLFPPCHTEVYVDEIPDEKYYGYRYCHRPLLVCFEIQRDLTEKEHASLADKALTFRLVIEHEGHFDKETGKPEMVDIPVKVNLDDLSVEGSIAGTHAVVVYLTLAWGGIRVSVKSDTPQLDFYNMTAPNYPFSTLRAFSVDSMHAKEITLFRPEPTGLFAGNPIIVADDFRRIDIKNRAIAAAFEKYGKEATKEAGKFVAGLIPVLGGSLGNVWEMGVEVLDGKIKDLKADKYTELVNGIASGLFVDILKKDDYGALFKLSGKGVAMMVVAEKLNKLYADLMKAINEESSSFVRGMPFGKCEQDTLYFMAVIKKSFTWDTKACAYTAVKEKPNAVIAVCNRQIDSNGNVFHYQFGDEGGLLTREDDRYFEKDSVSIHRAAFQQHVLAFSETLSELNPGDNADGYLRIIASRVRNQEVDFRDVLKKSKINETMVETSTTATEAAKRFLKGSQMSEEDLKKLGIFVNLFKYVD
ncbi:MAG: hypothetical protein GF344_19425, partial [Chitinivibrionales bacterium]|nr:hypothetical protein [Chitinivibrionales bacterium]MBD3358797.1 hypothetical protein [Chitinivibrionales bacterium]